MRVLLDINVILDAMLRRVPWHVEANAILFAAAEGRVTCAATTLAPATAYHLGRKAAGETVTRDAIRAFLRAFEILPIERQTLLDADALGGPDFEDDVHIAAAVTAGLDAIVTRNVSDFAHAPIPVWEPAEFLRRLTASGSPP